MAEYAFADIITGKDILTDQVKDADIIGVKGYFTDNIQVIVDAFDSKSFPDPLLGGILETVSYAGRFKRKADGKYYSYFIRKKEPEKKYVPFDLTKEEDRTKLRGAWVRHKQNPERENLITGLGDETVDFAVYFGDVAVGTGVLLENFEFVDGSPCGKLVEEE